jgi:hypothetical protein
MGVFSLTKSTYNGYSGELGLLIGKAPQDDLKGGFASLEFGQEGAMIRAGYGAFWQGHGVGDLRLGSFRLGGVVFRPHDDKASRFGAEISYSFWCALLRGGILGASSDADASAYIGYGLGL